MGTYATPAHHIKFENCTFRNIDATGNNDLLKLSGLDSFEIRHCVFLNGADGGSGMDMVGCHDGLIKNCFLKTWVPIVSRQKEVREIYGLKQIF
ncbi:MAG: hypothetical protein IPP15_10180 [Saprospiraceae bacterium]|uniref:Right handed beta helix domain-containing protein n=1 Tax=Candidatus Opimibacter skivensis TaxID=2982028 RepID=A0A9D7SXR2_9BACT|nr:hypothetical protein [Candidatus Opimibacter skivensis]